MVGLLKVYREHGPLHGVGVLVALDGPRVLHLARGGVHPPVLARARVVGRDGVVAASRVRVRVRARVRVRVRPPLTLTLTKG